MKPWTTSNAAAEPHRAPPASASPSLADARYEMKMVCQGLARDRVMAELRLLPAALRQLYPPRRVHSIYLDTHEGRALEENLAGVSDRKKIRFRWYGEEVGVVQGTLERKIRQNLLGWKEHFRLEEPIEVEGAGRWAWMRQLARRLTPEWRERLAGLEAVQWISYTREYLTTADRTVRITVDRGLRASDLRRCTRLSSRVSTPVANVTIVECKTSTDHFEDLRALLNSFPLVVDKCSKFVLASDPASGPLVSRFPG